MVLCRPGQNDSHDAKRQNGDGPVFVPRRKPSAVTEHLLAELRADVTPYDDLWFAGRPVS